MKDVENNEDGMW